MTILRTHDDDRRKLLRIAASFLWADHHLDDAEESFFVALARELDVPEPLATLRRGPPPLDDVDPATVPAALAFHARAVALRAIAADGVVSDEEMELFFLLDALLPDEPAPGPAERHEDEVEEDLAFVPTLRAPETPFVDPSSEDEEWHRYCA